VVRPLGVFLSTRGSKLKLNEKMFIGWVGPRGIVAAGIASLFGSKLIAKGEPGAEYITPLVFMIVLGTVLLNATTARLFAKTVGVFLKHSEGILIVGASKASRLIGNYLKSNNRHVVLIDNNPANIEHAKKLGLEAMTANIYSDTLTDNIELNDVGYLLAMTGNAEINAYAIKNLGEEFGENGAFRLVSSDELNQPESMPEEGLISRTDDFMKLTEAVQRNPAIQEITLKNGEQIAQLLSKAQTDDEVVPLFVKYPDGKLDIISSIRDKVSSLPDGSKLVYLGKVFDIEQELI